MSDSPKSSPLPEAAPTRYRPEIDGLRAFAVMPVILFHAGFSAWSGGYVGVDVFFVISGYLITGILLTDLALGRFSIARFYERRARRILPALFLVLLVSLVFAWLWMLPSQLTSFAGSLISVATFVSNIFFWASEDYFAPAAELLPLLHTWSLAVEEQFYVLFPPLLYLAWRLGWRRMVLAATLATLLSFAATLWAFRPFPSFTFYLLPTRIWELMAGALCAMAMMRAPPRPSSLLSLLGLALVTLPVFLYERTTAAPWLLLPVLGTCLILLFARAGTAGGRILAWRPFVGIGLISYSAYLWHQPLFAFARIRLPSEPSPGTMALLCAITLGLAALSWKYVEQPFRAGHSPRFAAQNRIFRLSTAGLVVALTLGTALILAQGAPFRVPDSVKRIDAARTDFNPLLSPCHRGLDAGMSGQSHPLPACFTGDTQGPPPIILTGDSHANAISWETRQAMAREGRPFYAVTMSSCPPIAGIARIGGADPMACDTFVRDMRAYATTSAAPILILAARWRFSIDGSKFDNGEGGHEFDDGSRAWRRADGGADGLEGDALRAAMLDAYVTDLKALLATGIQVILIYPIPEAGWNVPDRLARQRMASATLLDLSTSSAAYFKRNQMVIDAFDSIDAPNLRRVKPADILCDSFLPGRCVNSFGDQILYHDENHLSNAGARLIVPAIMEIVDQLSPLKP